MIEGDGKQMMMNVMMMIVMIMVGMMVMIMESTQSTDNGFAEDILEGSDVLIKGKLLSLSQVICLSCSDFRLNAAA
jgi:hypothetical protein